METTRPDALLPCGACGDYTRMSHYNLTCWLYLRHHSVLGLPGGCISSPSPCSAAALGLSRACERAWQWSQWLWQGLSIRGAAPSLSLHQKTCTGLICTQGLFLPAAGSPQHLHGFG